MSGRNALRMAMALMIAFCGAAAAASPTPCDGVDRALSEAQKVHWAPAIARQLGVAKVDVLQAFAFGGWRIVYVNTFQTDEAFLFYPHDPATSRYVTLWAGAAMEDEGPDIQAWAMKDAPGIPAHLAECFAWHVTRHRDR